MMKSGHMWITSCYNLGMANPNPPAPPNNTGKTYNRYVQDPRVMMFKQFFLQPDSTTFWNVRASAIRAGYSEHYANGITTQKPKWWIALIEDDSYMRAEMLHEAQKNLKTTLVSNPDDTTDKKLKHDASKFVTERLGS